jgi:putative transposase
MPAIKSEVLDELLSGMSSPEDLLGEGGVFRQLKKALMERALGAELTHHLGYERGAAAAGGARGNSRNGHSAKKVLTGDGEIELAIPRDRAGTFDPVLVPKGVTRLDGFDDKVISLYARGLSVREIQAHLKELYSTEVSPDLISRVTDAVLDEVAAWQNRPLEAVYPIVFFDALRVKVRDEGMVRNKAVYVALALDTAGQKHVLGLWIEQTEGAKFWLRVMNELKTRGLNDILIAVVDGLKGFPEAIGAVYPQATVQTCIVHTIRTQSAVGPCQAVVAWAVGGSRRWAQRDNMMDLEAAVADDDAFDDELQDRLFVGERHRVQARADALAKCRQVGPHRFGAQALLA